MIVSDKNQHNMVKKYCMHMYYVYHDIGSLGNWVALHEISNLMQGFTDSKITNNVVCIIIQYFFTILWQFLTETITVLWKKYCIHIYTTLLVTFETMKPCMRSLISCMRCSVYVHHKCTVLAHLLLSVQCWITRSSVYSVPFPCPKAVFCYRWAYVCALN